MLGSSQGEVSLTRRSMREGGFNRTRPLASFAHSGCFSLIVSVQRRFVVFGICVRPALLLELLSLPIHFIKDLLAEQFGFAPALAEPRPGMFPE